MSGEEKAAQIGNAAIEYQAAKVELAHIEKKLLTIFSAYSTAGECLNKGKGTVELPRVRNGKLDFGQSWRAGNFDQANLLNAADLILILKEHDESSDRLARAKREMVDLGIAGID